MRRNGTSWSLLAAAVVLAGVLSGQPTAHALQLVPDVAPPAEAVDRALGASWLTDDERIDLRIFFGRAQPEDLATPVRAARAAGFAWDFAADALASPEVARSERARALVARGRFTAALEVLGDDATPEGILARAEALAWLGRAEEALELVRSLDPVLDGTLPSGGRASPSDVVVAARAALLRGRLEPRTVADWQRILDALGRVRNEDDRLHWPALVVEGSLLAEKHHESQAIPTLQQAIALQPRSAEAWFRLGMIAADRFAFEAVDNAVRALRRILPRHPFAGVLEGQVALMRRDPDRAAEVLDRVLATEPTLPEAIALRAAADAVRHDLASAREHLERLEAIAPGNALGRFVVGRFLSENRQYDEAARFLAEAIERAPSWSDPRIALGLLETQTGRDAASIAALRAATELDPFNTRAANSLLLLEEMQSWPRFEGRHFIVRCRPGIDEIVAATMPEALDAMHEIVAGRLQHEPSQKTQIDLMPDHPSFAVRITGMTQIHTIAACTGPVIAIEVPKRGPRTKHLGLFDWLKVLRHEYAHTVTLSQTSNRIPHWLTEAIAVDLEMVPRDWSTCQMLARELEQGTLFDLESITWGFVRPIRPQDRSLAYAQGHWMVEFMGERFGEDAVVRLLAAYDRGVPESRAIPEVLGVSADAFYRAFLAWARDEVRSWGLAPEPSMQELFAELRERDPQQSAAYREALVDALEATVDELADQIGVPGDRRTQQLPGDAWPRPRTGPVEIDAAQLGEWLARHPNHPDLLEAAIRRAMRTLGEDASTPLDDATRDLIERYMKARPVDPYPHRILARRALASATPTDAIPHLAELDVREEHDNAYAIELAKLHRAKGDRAAARSSAERAVRMDPYDPAIRELAAAIAVEAGQLDAARVHLVALKALEPGQQRHEQRLKRLDELLER